MQDAIILYENGKAIGGEGHPTYARDITFENTGTDLVAETAQAAIVEVNEKTKHGIYEVWKNESPTTTFAGQSVQITGDYDVFLIIWGRSDATITYGITPIDVVDDSSAYIYNFVMESNKCAAYTRSVSFSKSGNINTLQFSDTDKKIWNTYGNSATSSTVNTHCVPKIILGVKHNS